ncbi:MAG: hypothetical protein ABEJ05_10230 [Haloglomus sp.]
MGPDDQKLKAALEELRERGKALLVAGAVPDAIHQQACSELFNGDAGRILIKTGRGQAAGVTPNDSDRVIEYDSGARSASTAASTASGPGGTGTLAGEFSGTNVTTVSTIPAAEQAFEDALAELQDTDTPTRVCVDSVLPFIDTAGEEQAFTFLHAVTGQVRNLGGTAHFHLSLPSDSATVRTFESLAEVTVELELADDQAQQRWRVHEEDVTSDWLPITDE